MFQLIRTSWMINPAGPVLLDDVQPCLDCDQKLEISGCASKIANFLARCVILACWVQTTAPLNSRRSLHPKWSYQKNDAFAPVTCSNKFDFDHCCFFFFDERTRRFVVEGPRVWLFGRSEGMVAKQILSVFFVRLCAVRPVARELQPTCMPLHDAYGPSREIVMQTQLC